MRHDAVSEKDEALADQRRRHDHEKLILQDENQKLIMDIDRVSCSSRRGTAVEAAGTAGGWGEVDGPRGRGGSYGSGGLVQPRLLYY